MATLATDKYDKLRLLLQQETFPFDYVHKFIGRSTPEFSAALLVLETDFPAARRVAERPSAAGANGKSEWLALTYSFRAADAEEIVRLLERTSQLPDLRYVL